MRDKSERDEITTIKTELTNSIKNSLHSFYSDKIILLDKEFKKFLSSDEVQNLKRLSTSQKISFKKENLPNMHIDNLHKKYVRQQTSNIM